jgi:hypothetical protein
MYARRQCKWAQTGQGHCTYCLPPSMTFISASTSNVARFRSCVTPRAPSLSGTSAPACVPDARQGGYPRCRRCCAIAAQTGRTPAMRIDCLMHTGRDFATRTHAHTCSGCSDMVLSGSFQSGVGPAARAAITSKRGTLRLVTLGGSSGRCRRGSRSAAHALACWTHGRVQRRAARPASLTRGGPIDFHGHAARARVHSNDSLRARWARAAGDVTCLLHLVEFASQLHSRPDVGTRFARTRVLCVTTPGSR